MTPLLPLILVSIPNIGIFKRMCNQKHLFHPTRIQAWTFHMVLCPNPAPTLIHHLVGILIMRTPNLFISYNLLSHRRLLHRTRLHPILQTFGLPDPHTVTRTMHTNIQILLSALSHLWRFSTLFRTRDSLIPVTVSTVLNAARRVPPNQGWTIWKHRVQSFHQLLIALRMAFPVQLCHR